jgi:hypothetical protein
MFRIPAYLFCIVCIIAIACSDREVSPDNNTELIKDVMRQEKIFNNLINVAKTIPEDELDDSLAFLILPIQASCASCRSKTIDSIVKYKDILPDRHFIIISANGGRKTITSFFRDRNAELPAIENRLFLDSTSQAYELGLYEEQPTLYYAYKKKAYRMIASKPSQIKKDLREFFSGKKTNEGKEVKEDKIVKLTNL